MTQAVETMKNLINYLNYHNNFYNENKPKISDADWDEKYFELQELEKKYLIYFNDSPTQSITYEVVNSLEKIEHNHEMLSLEKTKSIEEIESFLEDKLYLAMAKMDGLTCSLKYENGKLISAETRGDGKIGENILHNAKVIPSIPKEIPILDTLIIDGEIICSEKDFKKFFSGEYANPRNFAAGSVRLLDAKECSKRKLQFIAWDVIEGFKGIPLLSAKLKSLKECGFTIVPYSINKNVNQDIEELIELSKKYSYPIDGIVFKFDDIEYGKSLGKTAHHFKNALAFKPKDDIYESHLLSIDWTMGRTGQISPIAVFEPIDIEGTTINRASLHNISIMEEILGIPYLNQKVYVFKANMIIPQIERAEKIEPENNKNLEYFSIPEVCPICGEKVSVKGNVDTKVLYCTNFNCEGKLINRLEHFAGKKGLDIKGLSKATLEKLINWEWISTFKDLFELKQYRNEWVKKPGFGVKSVDNILNAIESSRECKLDTFITAIGIPLIGSAAAKDLAKTFLTWEKFITAVDSEYAFWKLSNFGPEMHAAITKFNYNEAKELAKNYLIIKNEEKQSSNKNNTLEGINFVITGKVSHFKNRNELKNNIEARGGKVSSVISNKTNYLINNDIESNSSKNNSAKKIGIPIISENIFIEMFGI